MRGRRMPRRLRGEEATVTLRVPAEIKSEAGRLAREKDLSLSAYLREALKEKIERERRERRRSG